MYKRTWVLNTHARAVAVVVVAIGQGAIAAGAGHGPGQAFQMVVGQGLAVAGRKPGDFIRRLRSACRMRIAKDPVDRTASLAA